MGLLAKFRKTDTIQDTKVPCLLNRQICGGRYLLDKKLGQGGYSVVYRGIDTSLPVTAGRTPNYVAVKCILARNKTRNEREFEIHRLASKVPGVVKFFEVFDEKNLCFAILEYCPNGDLYSAMVESNMLFGCERGIKKLFLQILDTIAGLHELGIFHRDLKPENFLLSSDYQSVRLADFGLATMTDFSSSVGCGSMTYMTPDCLNGTYRNGVQGFSSRASDVWASCIILLNMITERTPWKLAAPSDPAFRSWQANSDFLTMMFPISSSAAAFCEVILRSYGENLCVRQLRKDFASIDVIYMSEIELAGAAQSARIIGAMLPRMHVPLAVRCVDSVDDESVEGCDCESCNGGEMSENENASEVASVSVSVASSKYSATSASDTSVISSGVGSLTDTSTSDSLSEGPATPETKPVKFERKANAKPLLSPVIEEPWVRSPWLVDAFRKKSQAEIESMAADNVNNTDIDQLLI